VLSAIISRVRGATGAIPLVRAYDKAERNWSPPLPLLFQRRVGFEHRAISSQAIRRMLSAAIDRTGLTDPAAGEPLRFTPHDFRRLFITDAVLNGVPPHIAQVIAGHRDINVTLGYKAVYPDEAIQSHLAFLARRRALRPTDEYRQPTDEEWQRFLGHPSNVAKFPSAPADAPSAPPASMNMLVSVAHCSGQTPLNDPDWSRSAKTCKPASPKPNARAGSAKSKDSRSASPEPRTNSLNSTVAPPTPLISECPR
jgi:hypothetical protein